MFTNPEVPLSSLPSAVDLHWHPLHPRFVTRILVQRAITVGVMTVLLGATTVFFQMKRPWEGEFNSALPVAWTLAICFFAWRMIWPVFEVPRRGYAVREKDIAFKSGVLWRSSTIVPFNRVQHAATGSGMLDRKFGLAALTVFTAGGAGADLHIAGLAAEHAERLRVYVVNKVGGSLEEAEPSLNDGLPNNDEEPSAGEREGLAPRMKGASAREREGLADEEASAREREERDQERLD